MFHFVINQTCSENEQVLSCWVVMIIPIPLPQYQHTFLSETTFRPRLPWSSGVFDLTKTTAILVETSSLTKKCAGAEGEELVLCSQNVPTNVITRSLKQVLIIKLPRRFKEKNNYFLSCV